MIKKIPVVFPKNEEEREEMARLLHEGKAAWGGDEPLFKTWPNNRVCLREPIVEIEAAAQMLSEAVDAHLQGDEEAAARLLRASNSPLIREWLESLWGPRSPYMQFRKLAKAEPHLKKDQRIGSRMPTSTEKFTLLNRDHYRCRFCGMPVVRAEVRRKLHKLYPEAVPWDTSSNEKQHAALQAMWAQYDHVLPHSRGGCTTLENLIVTCAGCNYGRMEHTLAEVGVIDPRMRPPMPSAWDGLERLLVR